MGSLNTQNFKIGKNNSGPSSAGIQPESQSSDVTSGGPPQPGLEDQRRGYEYSARYPQSESATGGRPSDSSYDNMDTDVPMTDKGSVYSGKDDAPRPGSWAAPRDMAHSYDDREFDSERTATPRPAMADPANVDARPAGGPDGGPEPDGYDRMQEHRARRGEWTDRDRSYPDRGRDTRLTDTRRSSSVAEQRQYDAEYGQPPARRGTAEPPLPPDARHLSENPPAGDVRPPVDARPPPDTRADARAAPTRTNERLGLDNTEDIQSLRSSSVRPTDASAPLGSIPPPATSGDDIVDDPSVRPSLKERLNPARSSRTPTEAPMGSGDQHPPPHYAQERSRKPNKYRGNANTHGGPPYDESRRLNSFGRPMTPSADDSPPHNTAPGGPPPPRRPFIPHGVEGRKNHSPASRGGHRDFRGPGRSVSRDRAGYRPDFHDPRYPGGVDPEVPRYEGRPYREFSPPPMSGGRGLPSDAPPGRDYHQYPPAARREWGGPHEEEEYYKSRGWDGPPHEKGRYERDYPPPPRAGGWEGRSEREYVARGICVLLFDGAKRSE